MIKWLVLAIFVGSALYVHFRGRVRFGLQRQVLAYETFLAPLNGFMYLFSAAPHKPYQDIDEFPQLQVLQDNWQVFREEAMKLAEAAANEPLPEKRVDVAFNSFLRRGWRRFYLKWYDEPLPSARTLCPKSTELVESIPGLRAAMFAVLPPGGTLMKHRDPYAGSLRYHLGLVTPNSDNCMIWVDGEPYSWRDGEDVLFDETFIHWAENQSDTSRIILFCDIERPMRFRWAQAVNRWVAWHLMRAAASPNQAGDKVGILNRLFHQVYKVREVGRAVKEWNRAAYYLLKYAIVIGLIWLIFFT